MSDDTFRGERGAAFAHATVDQLNEHAVPTTPANYEVWTAHRSGTKPDLSREIEQRLARGETFTDEANDDLFERYFANTRLSAQILEASESIARELTSVVATLREAGQRAGSYSGALDEVATSFERGMEITDVRTVVMRLATATRDMAARNRDLCEQMATSSRQVEALQTALQTVKVEALTDSLTGIANRKLFDETLKRRIGEADADLCLLMCDIDHFKRVNDTWGHVTGDQIIRLVAHTIRDAMKRDALCARYGGEEFAVILPRTSVVDARILAEGVRQALAAKKLVRRSSGTEIGYVTVSIGIAQLRRNEKEAELVARADACLYASKNAGRDRVTADADDKQAA